MNAVAELAANIQQCGKFVNLFWDAQIPDSICRYSDGTFYILALFDVSGDFKIYTK